MSRRISKFLLPVCVLVILAAGVIYTLPDMWAKGVPGLLNKQVSPLIVVDKASFNRSPPELVLNNVHLLNPGAYGPGDAIAIGQINVVFEDYSRNPYRVKSITVQNIRGKYQYRDNRSNFVALHRALMERKIQTARGELAKNMTLQQFVIHDALLASADGQRIVPLAERRLSPVDNERAVQDVVLDIFGTVIEQQLDGTTVFAVDNLATKAEETIKSLSDSVKGYFSKSE